MSAAPFSTEQFWLLAGAVPVGPFTVAQVHAELATGRATWDTRACRVGESSWLLLKQVPGIGPTEPATSGGAEPPTVPAPVPIAFVTAPVMPGEELKAPITSTSAASSPPTNRAAAAIGLGFLIVSILAVGATVYGAYEWLRPLTATEVCKRMEAAKTAAQAKALATPRMHPLLDRIYADKSPDDPNAEFAYTQEVDGPVRDTRLVGFRGAMFVQEAGRRVQVEGHLKLVRADGWKVDDMVFTGIEGASLPGPFSLVDEYARPDAPKPQPTTAARSTPAASKATGNSPSVAPGSWYERNTKLLGFLGLGLVIAAGKAIGDAMKKRHS